MIIQYVKGNIVEIFQNGNDIAHECNCFCLMGAGVAYQLANAYPPIRLIDADTQKSSHEKLGDFSYATHKNDVNVCYNLYTQYHPGPNVDYGAIFNAFLKLNKVRKNSIRTLYIPRIGAGIANGDWLLIEKLINLATPNINIIVVDFNATATADIDVKPKPKKSSDQLIPDLDFLMNFQRCEA